MKLLLFIAATLTFFTFVINYPSSFWIGLEKANRTNIKKYEKHCLERIYNTGPMDKGEVKRISGACLMATCLEDRNIQFSGCPSVVISDRVNCHVYQGNLSKPYPECCYELKCNETKETSEIYAGYINITAVDINRKKKKKEKQSESDF